MQQVNEMEEPIRNTTGKIVTFAPSVPMSTYLVSFTINDFKFKEILVDVSGKAIPLRVYGADTQKGGFDYALETGRTLLKYYIIYFGVDYPLPKL
ncbi:hypothetical protein ILUMI_16088, partial [Ignelater luminosus]